MLMTTLYSMTLFCWLPHYYDSTVDHCPCWRDYIFGSLGLVIYRREWFFDVTWYHHYVVVTWSLSTTLQFRGTITLILCTVVLRPPGDHWRISDWSEILTSVHLSIGIWYQYLAMTKAYTLFYFHYFTFTFWWYSVTFRVPWLYISRLFKLQFHTTVIPWPTVMLMVHW